MFFNFAEILFKFLHLVTSIFLLYVYKIQSFNSRVMIELSTICQIILLYYHTDLRFNILTCICMHLTSYIVHVYVNIYMYLFTALPDDTHTIGHHCQVRFTTKHLSSERLHKRLQLTLGPHNKCWRKKMSLYN